MLTQTTQPLLDVADLCRMFEESESASLTARKDAERDRGFMQDGMQLTTGNAAHPCRRSWW
jgi:hypothetical protein